MQSANVAEPRRKQHQNQYENVPRKYHFVSSVVFIGVSSSCVVFVFNISRVKNSSGQSLNVANQHARLYYNKQAPVCLCVV